MEEEESKKDKKRSNKSASRVVKSKSNQTSGNPDNSEDEEEDGNIDNYLSDHWSVFRDTEYYKFFFLHDNPNESLVVPRLPAAEKKKRKKRKNRSKLHSGPVTTVSTSDTSNKPPAKLDTKLESSETENNDDHHNVPPSNSQQKLATKCPLVEKEEDKDKVTDSENFVLPEKHGDTTETEPKDSEEALLAGPCVQPAAITVAAVVPKEEDKKDCVEEEEEESKKSRLNAQNLEKLQYVDPINMEEITREVQRKNKRASKKQKALMQDAKREYEELKAKAMEMFAASTSSSCASKSKKAKKKNNKAACNAISSKDSVNNNAGCSDYAANTAKSVTPSTVGSFTPKRSQTPNKATTDLSRKLVMSPQSDTHYEKRLSMAETERGEEKMKTRRGGKKPTQNVPSVPVADSVDPVQEPRRKLGLWRGREIVYRKKESKKLSEGEQIVPSIPATEPIVEKSKEVVSSSSLSSTASPYLVYEPFYLEELKSEQIFSKLNVEIAAAVHELDLYNQSLYPVCETVRGLIEREAQKFFSQFGLVRAVLYGSVATGLALEDSDVDITIQKLYTISPEEYLFEFENFGEELRHLGFVLECKTIATARVPVIKLVVDLSALGIKFSRSVLKVDITLDDETNGPLVTYGVMFTDWAIKKLQLVPLMKPIVVLLKRLLYANGLNIPYYGGLSSYTLILMISALLHTCPPLPTLAHYFLEALRYYGTRFQSDRMVVVQGEYISIVDPNIVSQDELMVADLFCPGVNAASNVTRFKDIRTLFRETFRKIYENSTEPSILKAISITKINP